MLNNFRYRNELARHGIKSLETSQMDDINITLPKLSGKNIEEHFYNISKNQVESYQKLINSIVSANVPEMPKVRSIMTKLSSVINPCFCRTGHSLPVGLATIRSKELFQLHTRKKMRWCLTLKFVFLFLQLP